MSSKQSYAINFLNTAKVVAGLAVAMLAIAGVISSDAQAMKFFGKAKNTKKVTQPPNHKVSGVEAERRQAELERKFKGHKNSSSEQKELSKKALANAQESENTNREGLKAETQSLTSISKQAEQAIANLNGLMLEAKTSTSFPPQDKRYVGHLSANAVDGLGGLTRGPISFWNTHKKGKTHFSKQFVDFQKKMLEQGEKLGLFVKIKKGWELSEDKTNPLKSINEAEEKLFPEWDKYDRALKDHSNSLAGTRWDIRTLLPQTSIGSWASGGSDQNAGRGTVWRGHEYTRGSVSNDYGQLQKPTFGIKGEVGMPLAYRDYESNDAKTIRDNWRKEASEDLTKLIEYCKFVQQQCKAQLPALNIMTEISVLQLKDEQRIVRTDMDAAIASSAEVDSELRKNSTFQNFVSFHRSVRKVKGEKPSTPNIQNEDEGL